MIFKVDFYTQQNYYTETQEKKTKKTKTKSTERIYIP